MLIVPDAVMFAARVHDQADTRARLTFGYSRTIMIGDRGTSARPAHESDAATPVASVSRAVAAGHCAIFLGREPDRQHSRHRPPPPSRLSLGP